MEGSIGRAVPRLAGLIERLGPQVLELDALERLLWALGRAGGAAGDLGARLERRRRELKASLGALPREGAA
jgi:hypothetical protein